MKLRSKLLLSATCLLTISVAATATSAYAWFTANRQAFVSATGMNVKSDVDEVFIEEVKEGSSSTASKEIELSTPVLGTDVSGNGVNLYKPSFKNADASIANSIVKVNSYDDVNKLHYFNEFKIKFTKENQAVTTGLFLSHTSTIKKASGSQQNDPDLSGAYRVAILDSTATTLLAYYAPYDTATGTDGGMEFVKSTKLTEGKLDKKYVSVSELGLTGDYASNLLDSSFNADITDVNKPVAKNAPKSYLGTIDKTNGLTLVVRIWCEGTDGDCKTDNLKGKVDVNLVFNGVTMGSASSAA